MGTFGANFSANERIWFNRDEEAFSTQITANGCVFPPSLANACACRIACESIGIALSARPSASALISTTKRWAPRRTIRPGPLPAPWGKASSFQPRDSKMRRTSSSACLPRLLDEEGKTTARSFFYHGHCTYHGHVINRGHDMRRLGSNTVEPVFRPMAGVARSARAWRS